MEKTDDLFPLINKNDYMGRLTEVYIDAKEFVLIKTMPLPVTAE